VPGFDTPEYDSNLPLDPASLPYEMNSPAVSLLVQAQNQNASNASVFNEIATGLTASCQDPLDFAAFLSTALFSS
jgi:hypothetical protein